MNIQYGVVTLSVDKTLYHPQFFTATILEWREILVHNKYKDIIVESLRFLVNQKRVKVYAFVIMPNHLHLIWQIREGHKRQDVQRDFLRFTAQQIRFNMQIHHPQLLEQYEVNAKDRRYQFWERNALTIDLLTEAVSLQKLNYIHNNPLQEKWKLCLLPEDYHYSSARFYLTGVDDWGFLTHLSS